MQSTLDEIGRVRGRTSVKVLLALGNNHFPSTLLLCFRGLYWSKKTAAAQADIPELANTDANPTWASAWAVQSLGILLSCSEA